MNEAVESEKLRYNDMEQDKKNPQVKLCGFFHFNQVSFWQSFTAQKPDIEMNQIVVKYRNGKFKFIAFVCCERSC